MKFKFVPCAALVAAMCFVISVNSADIPESSSTPSSTSLNHLNHTAANSMCSRVSKKMRRFHSLSAACFIKALKDIPSFKPQLVQQCCGQFNFIHCLRKLEMANECRLWVEEEISRNEERLNGQGVDCTDVDEVKDCGIGSSQEQQEFGRIPQSRNVQEERLCDDNDDDCNAASSTAASPFMILSTILTFAVVLIR